MYCRHSGPMPARSFSFRRLHWKHRNARLAPPVVGATGVIQTVPSLALLAFMIPIPGLGARSAIAALFLYALLPILRNTCTGIREVDADLI
jgi:osmoprotectant transport system permease protein